MCLYIDVCCHSRLLFCGLGYFGGGREKQEVRVWKKAPVPTTTTAAVAAAPPPPALDQRERERDGEIISRCNVFFCLLLLLLLLGVLFYSFRRVVVGKKERQLKKKSRRGGETRGGTLVLAVFVCGISPRCASFWGFCSLGLLGLLGWTTATQYICTTNPVGQIVPREIAVGQKRIIVYNISLAFLH